jgi:electron transport complex protein RnfB
MEIILPLCITVMTAIIGCVSYAITASLHKKAFYGRVLQVHRILPGYNCGVCGFSECIGFAEAIAADTARISGCVPGGPETMHGISDIVGTTVQPGEPVMAAVHCKGGAAETKMRAAYQGIDDCHASIILGNGAKACHEGCLGLGSCVKVCPFGALSINKNGIAVVNRHRCTGCGTCISECPRSLLLLIPHVHKIFLACNNHNAGEQVTACCTVGCTACGKCVEATPTGAITMVDNLPRLDYFTPNENFVAAVHSCPSKCFIDTIKARPKANIDTKCDGCGACIAVCPAAGAIEGRSGQRHVIKKELCIGCGRCLNSCHVRAISLWGSLGYQEQMKSKK